MVNTAEVKKLLQLYSPLSCPLHTTNDTKHNSSQVMSTLEILQCLPVALKLKSKLSSKSCETIMIWPFPNFLPQLSLPPGLLFSKATQATRLPITPSACQSHSFIHSFAHQFYVRHSNETKREQDALQAAWGTHISWGFQKSEHTIQLAEAEFQWSHCRLPNKLWVSREESVFILIGHS